MSTVRAWYEHRMKLCIHTILIQFLKIVFPLIADNQAPKKSVERVEGVEPKNPTSENRDKNTKNSFFTTQKLKKQ